MFIQNIILRGVSTKLYFNFVYLFIITTPAYGNCFGALLRNPSFHVGGVRGPRKNPRLSTDR